MNHKIRLAHRIAIDGCDNGFQFEPEIPSDLAVVAENGIKQIKSGNMASLDITNAISAAPRFVTIDSCPYCMPPFQWTMCEVRCEGGESRAIVSFCDDLRKKNGTVIVSHFWVFFCPKDRRPWIPPLIIRQELNDKCQPIDNGKFWRSSKIKGTKFDLEWMCTCVVASYAFSLLSCKNVSSVDVPQDWLPDAKWQRRQAGKIKGLTFKTLKIDGLGSGPRSPSGEPSGAHNSFHICRGNFAEYTAEKPLFGKYVGRFWRPSHVKGSKKVGVVEKDYSIEPADRSFDASTDGQ